jgi:hypothetical protein
MFKKYFRYTVSVVSALFWVLIIFAFESPREAALTVIAALIHEWGHILYTLCFLPSSSVPHSVLSGLRIKKVGIIPYRKELFLYLSGPLANLISILLALLFSNLSSDFLGDFALISLFTMISNLLPIEGYDGYGALMSISGMLGSGELEPFVLKWISFFFTALMTLISLYLMYYLNGGYWIFAIFSVSTLSFIKKSLEMQKRRF